MNLDDALETFIAEARDLLQAMEDALLALEPGRPDADGINAIFRAAHTIKGSSGLFGLDHIVAFTHRLENVLDRVRNGTLAVDPDLVQLLLACRDHLSRLVEGVAGGHTQADADTQARGAELSGRLAGYLGEQAAKPAATKSPAVQAEAASQMRNWHISVRFGRDVLRNGMDPLSFIRYLATLGTLRHVEPILDAMPPAAEMDPESCYLGFEIALESGATQEQIEAVFEFVRSDCELAILAPDSTVDDCIALIRSLPEGEMKLGEILVKCGTITREELAAAVHEQVMLAQAQEKPLGQMLVDAGKVDQRVVDAGLERQRQSRKSQEGVSVRVDAHKLDQLIDLIGELVIAGSAVGMVGQKARLAELTEAVSTLSRLVESVRDRALQLRMVQIGATYNRFKRVVHDVSRELNKDIDLVITGEDTELDKTVVEQINDPLTHLVRNAMDHGIEPAAVRVENGKPARGTVRLNAYHDSGSIAIEISDDGGGLKRDRILAKAIERGLVEPEATLSDADVFGLIFEPGFSTAEQITNLSGRGVGLDVVKRNVTALRGEIDVSSEPGRGTRFRIHLPLTLAIIDGFLVRLGEATFVVPLDTVEECIEMPRSTNPAEASRDYVNLRGHVLPFVRMRQLFAVNAPARERENIVVVKHAGKRIGLLVDELLGEAQTVIKPLGRLFQGISGISGSTILGDGKVALILDVPGLVRQAQGGEAGVRGDATGGRAERLVKLESTGE